MAELGFEDLFQIEMDGWCHGIEKNLKDLNNKMVMEIIGELAPAFESAIEHNYAFDIVKVAKDFERSSQKMVQAKEVSFYILSTLPHPKNFDEEQKKTLAEIIAKVEKKYGGAKERLKNRWQDEG